MSWDFISFLVDFWSFILKVWGLLYIFFLLVKGVLEINEIWLYKDLFKGYNKYVYFRLFGIGLVIVIFDF